MKLENASQFKSSTFNCKRNWMRRKNRTESKKRCKKIGGYLSMRMVEKWKSEALTEWRVISWVYVDEIDHHHCQLQQQPQQPTTGTTMKKSKEISYSKDRKMSQKLAVILSNCLNYFAIFRVKEKKKLNRIYFHLQYSAKYKPWCVWVCVRVCMFTSVCVQVSVFRASIDIENNEQAKIERVDDKDGTTNARTEMRWDERLEPNWMKMTKRCRKCIIICDFMYTGLTTTLR